MVIISRDEIVEDVEDGAEEVELAHSSYKYEPPKPNHRKCDLFVLSDGVPKIASDLEHCLKTCTFSFVMEDMECNAGKDDKTSSYLEFGTLKMVKVKDGTRNSLFAMFLQVNMTTKIRIWRALEMSGNLQSLREALCSNSMVDEICNFCFLQDDSTWDEQLGRRLSLVLDESQTTAALSSILVGLGNHKFSIKLIYGPPGTGKTKTPGILLYTISSKSCRTFSCSRTNVAVKDVGLHVLKLVEFFYHMNSGRDELLCSLGHFLLSGSRKCLEGIYDLKTDQWKTDLRILISPSNWEIHLLQKEGIVRSRNHNFPLTCSCASLYELRVASNRTNLGLEVRKLDQNQSIVGYLKADNIGERLQHYGWVGCHLDGKIGGKSTDNPNADSNLVYQRGLGMSREIFFKGFPIVPRWASLENKKEAEKTVTQLLHVFDYTWSTGGNGVRRPNDTLLKLDKISSSTNSFPYVSKKPQQIFLERWSKLQQRLLVLEQSFFGKKSGTQIKSVTPISSDASNDRHIDNSHSRVFKFGRTQPCLVFGKCDINKEGAVICGVSLGDGSLCRVKPVRDRKRCQKHKWMRIIGCVQPVNENKSVCGVNLEDGSCCMEVPVQGRKRCALHKGMRISTAKHGHDKGSTRSDSNRKSKSKENCIIICGVLLRDGSVCNARPVEGRKRCGEHKGQWANNVSIFKSRTEKTSVICGVGLENGSVCMENPVKGRKRCRMHKGRRITSASLGLIYRGLVQRD